MDIVIYPLCQADRSGAFKVFEESITDAFEKEGLGSFKESIASEIAHKKNLLDASLGSSGSDPFFLIAKAEGTVIGTISYGKSGPFITGYTEAEIHTIGELGSLYILPEYQDCGVGSALIHAMAEHLYKCGFEHFCLDSGYKRAQKRWLRKFGDPFKVVKDFWGPGSNHYIWVCKTVDYISRGNSDEG